MERRLWHNHYETGIANNIPEEKLSSLAHLIDESVHRYQNQEAFLSMGKSVSYGEIGKLSDAFAAYLTNDLGLKKGDAIAIQLPNTIQYPVVLFGAIKVGLVIVNTNPLYTSREMAHQLKDSGAKAIVILDNFASKLEGALPELTDLKHIVTTGIGDLLDGAKGHLVNFAVKYIKRMVPGYKLPGAVKLKSALKAGHGQNFTRPQLGPEDPAFLQYTGGTSGVLKAAVLRHRNILANVAQLSQWMSKLLVLGQETVGTAIPLYHIFALTANCFLFFKAGGRNVLIANPRDMVGFLKEIRHEKITVLTGVNTLFNGMLNHKDFDKVDFSRLKLTIGGAMAVQKSVADRWLAKTGVALSEGYGLTEASPVVAVHPFNKKVKQGSIGLPLPGIDVSIRDDAGMEMPLGQAGELCLKGPNVMAGYWKDGELEPIGEDGWLATGDIAYMDETGYVFIVDRKKDMILVSGFNVYPNEVEEVIASHPKVLECGVVGIADEDSNERVKAFVVRKDDSLTVEEIRKHCKKSLTRYKVPKLVDFRDELPKSPVGKILRRKLK
ncbi:long-chain-fatty-acid--CoA ligase [Fulvitalea axinellae]|uniref:Long-chain-fatty-acid--CoA ligase n=1 Tax=Fulvitalea axinellae TaxID=1182444 RepID=A0AAU9CFZ3_9BACT|nr:long-chain-fatty-acid--CoA ligase [Fulvitalea axinellae]